MSIEFFGSIMLVLAVSDFGLFQIPMTSFSNFRGNSFMAFLVKSPNKNKNNKNLDQFNIIIIINSIIMIFSFSIKLIIKTNLKCSDWIVLFMFFISHLTTKWEWRKKQHLGLFTNYYFFFTNTYNYYYVNY